MFEQYDLRSWFFCNLVFMDSCMARCCKESFPLWREHPEANSWGPSWIIEFQPWGGNWGHRGHLSICSWKETLSAEIPLTLFLLFSLILYSLLSFSLLYFSNFIIDLFLLFYPLNCHPETWTWWHTLAPSSGSLQRARHSPNSFDSMDRVSCPPVDWRVWDSILVRAHTQ